VRENFPTIKKKGGGVEEEGYVKEEVYQKLFPLFLALGNSKSSL
jgi:hypothetical protein